MLPINKAGDMVATMMPCQPEALLKSIVNAIYKHGDKAYGEEMRSLIDPILSQIDLREFGTKDFNIEAEINEKGDISKLKAINSFEDKISNSLINALRRLPSVQPALVNGKPTPQKISFKFRFENGFSKYSYQILPLTPIIFLVK